MMGRPSPHPAPRTRNRRLNVIVVAIVVAVAVGSFVALRVWSGGGGASTSGIARITDGDGNVYEMPLDTDAERTVTTSLGTNVVEVRDGRVRVREADCPNQDCVNQGWIDSSSQQIVCLPHRLYVDVVGGEDSDVDVVGR